MPAKKKYKSKAERLAAKKKYYEKNKKWLNTNRREKRRFEREKKPKSKFKNCTNCKKKLEKNETNFRFKSKEKGILTFRPVCRPCERKLNSEYIKTPLGKKIKALRDQKYKASPKGKAADKRYYDKNQPTLMKKAVARRAIKRKTDPHTKIRDNLSLRMRLALREQNLTKRNYQAEVGCSIQFLKKYLESMFYPNSETNEIIVGTEPLIGAVSYPKSIKPCSKLGSGISVIWLKPTNVNPKNKSISSFFICTVLFYMFYCCSIYF